MPPAFGWPISTAGLGLTPGLPPSPAVHSLFASLSGAPGSQLVDSVAIFLSQKALGLPLSSTFFFIPYKIAT